VPTELPEDFVRRVTQRIAEVRRERGVTQDELAEALGTATRNLQRLEAGQNVTLHTLARVATALGVDPEVFVVRPVRARRRYGPTRPPTEHAVSEPRGSLARHARATRSKR
jgi:transcriptional regulator with XRE-family HTH domain